MRDDRDQSCRRQHPDGGQHGGRKQDRPCGRQRRVQSTIKENQGERRGAKAECEGIVVEGNPPDPLGPRQHADQEKEQCDGKSQARGRATQGDTRAEQQSEGGKKDRGGHWLCGGHM